jgi:hypothetical protein
MTSISQSQRYFTVLTFLQCSNIRLSSLKQKSMLFIDFYGIVNCNTFSVAPSITNDNVTNALFHCHCSMTLSIATLSIMTLSNTIILRNKCHSVSNKCYTDCRYLAISVSKCLCTSFNLDKLCHLAVNLKN